MEEAETRLKLRGIQEATLYIEESNKEVVEFYKKRGWNVFCNIICMDKNIS